MVDTAEKRRSLSGIQTTLLPGVTPNASKDQEWRQEAGWGYPGILAQFLTSTAAKLFRRDGIVANVIRDGVLLAQVTRDGIVAQATRDGVVVE